MKRKFEDSDYKVHVVKHINLYQKNGDLLLQIVDSTAKYLINKFSELYTFSNLFHIFNTLSKNSDPKIEPNFEIAHLSLALLTHFSPLHNNPVIMKFVRDSDLTSEFLEEMKRINLGLEKTVPRNFLSFFRVLNSKMMRKEVDEFYEKIQNHWRSNIFDTEDEFISLISFIFSFKNGLFYPMSMKIDELFSVPNPIYKRIKELLISRRDNLLTLFLMYILCIILKTQETKVQTYLCLSLNFEGQSSIQELSRLIREKKGFREKEEWRLLGETVLIILESLSKI